MRISIIVSRERRDDALLILETVGFVRDDAPDPPSDAERPEFRGEFPEKSVRELPAIDGVLDWKVLPLEEEDARSDGWPWKQKPETD